MDLGLDGKVCVVTGASRGIGLAAARMLAEEGARVLSVSRGGEGEDALALDVTDPDAPERLLEACGDAPWALVNNAGVTRARPLEKLADEDWNEQWELHVMAPMRLMRALAPRMAEAGGGRIVNVCSSSGKRPSLTLDAAYSVTKAAQLSLSRVFADAYAGKGVLVNALAPGPVETPLWMAEGGLADEIAEAKGSTREEVLRGTREKIPLGRMGTQEEIAAAIAYLCSERASNVAGAAWSVDGGSVQVII
jgi:3-oxoacyl-[acyl-carrier protein] reductase